jgi:hypothetical protein
VTDTVGRAHSRGVVKAPLTVRLTSTTGKHPDPSLCEDLIADGPEFLVVCDGATDKSGLRFDGKTGGRVFAELVCDVVAAARAGTSGAEMVAQINAEYMCRLGLALIGRCRNVIPSGSFVSVDKVNRRVIRVGDCSWRTATRDVTGTKRVDDVAADARASMLTALISSGMTVEELIAADPGRQMLMPLLQAQTLFGNSADPEFGFGVINGNPVPNLFVEEWELTPDEHDLVLTTDGYPKVFMTLEETEQYLREDLISDPLRIGKHRTTKGIAAGNVSFDDRAFVLLSDR